MTRAAGRHRRGDDLALRRGQGLDDPARLPGRRSRSTASSTAIDWGWFFFLTKPIFRVLHEMHKLIGNMGLAIIGADLPHQAACCFPLAYKSYVSMSKMKALQPEMEKIKETRRRRPDEDAAGDDGALQAGEGQPGRGLPADPAADPDLLLALQGDLRHHRAAPRAVLRLDPGPVGARPDLDPQPLRAAALGGAGGRPASLGIISIGVWPILLGISMWLQQKLNPAPADKTQAMIFAWMPWIFMFMLGQLRQRAGDLLGGEQHHHLRPAVHDHAQPGRAAERARQHPRAAEAAPEGGVSGWRGSAALWRHPIKGHGVEAVRGGDARRRRDHALGPGLGDRARGGAGRAGAARLGALRQLQPRREVAAS